MSDRRLDEAALLARYLVGETPRPQEAERYREAVRLRGVELARARDRRLWDLMMRRPAMIGVVDAGLALTDPHSPVRHRIYLMLAILEASPAHCRHFLPAPYPRVRLAGVAWRGALAALRALAGIALVRSYGVLWR
ncbi:MAG: hypothetical protein A2V63_09400 [Candidatus Eisenbacteria bacterium RBG_19FT_COMBO_70_11]|nr:MAG: hypothetical protein A2V63_09400 [Candidatus Eisenbacteria bacterium RBG_19FT_COMBO_70_11]